MLQAGSLEQSGQVFHQMATLCQKVRSDQDPPNALSGKISHCLGKCRGRQFQERSPVCGYACQARSLACYNPHSLVGRDHA